MIPKILHCIWISDKPMPEKFQKYVDTWKFEMPDYEINYVTLANLKHSPFVDKYLAQGKYTVANHYVRLQEVYDKGGIYLDLDIEVVKSFDPLLDNTFFAGWEDQWVVNNAVFGAEAGHYFLKKCLDDLDKIDPNIPQIELETGPRLFTRNVDENLVIYTEKYFYPYHYTKKFTPDCIKPNTYCIHHWANSWSEVEQTKLSKTISVIIPCYNYAHYLDECLQSVINQTHKAHEIIVVDDGSSDNPKEICEKYPNVTYLRKENGGLSSARNFGIKHATGEYIMCLDADDTLPENSLFLHLSKADKYVISQCGLKEFGVRNESHSPQGGDLQTMLIGNSVYCNAVFPKKVWEITGGYDESDIMRLGYEDWEFWIRCMAKGCRIETTPEIGLNYRIHMTSMTRTTTQKNAQKLINYIREKNYKLYE